MSLGLECRKSLRYYDLRSFRDNAFEAGHENSFQVPVPIHSGLFLRLVALDSLRGRGVSMATVTKKELIDRIAERSGYKRVLIRQVIQAFLDEIIEELGCGNRLEFRDFGVFESKIRAARQAQNPKTLDKVQVPPKRTVKFKVGRVMKDRLSESIIAIDEATGLTVDSSASTRSTNSAKRDGPSA